MSNSEKENWQKVIDRMEEKGTDFSLGSYYLNNMSKDIKHVMFSLSRYKFASKMLSNIERLRVLELGCNEGIGAMFFEQTGDLQKYTGVDLDEKAIEWSQNYLQDDKKDFILDDFIGKKYGEYDAVVSLDVIEHISSEREAAFMETAALNLSKTGIAVIGTPNITMTPYASEASRIAHINLFDEKRLYQLMRGYFSQVFLFSMNDEVVHTGFSPMACYLFALCCNPITKN